MNPSLSVLTVFCLLSVVSGAPVPKEKPNWFGFPIAVGTKWVYTIDGRDHIETIISVERKNGVVIVLIGSELNGQVSSSYRVLLSDKGLYKERLGVSTPSSAVCLLPRNYQPGDEWVGELFDKRSGSFKIVGPEKVQVPAGKYEAVRVDWREQLPNGGVLTVTAWYVPNVGLVKMVETGNGRKVQKLLCKINTNN